MTRDLLIGCGSSRAKKLWNGRQPWSNLTTLDINREHKPDVVHDLNVLPLPFEDNSFAEIHAYDVLEHVGTQGDYRFFFAQWADFWRILEPGGQFFGICPHIESPWAWGDPGHTRIIAPESFIFLDQSEYQQIGKTTMTDYRFCYKADFERLACQVTDRAQTAFILRAVKPSRCVL